MLILVYYLLHHSGFNNSRSNEEKRKATDDEKDAHDKRQRVCNSIQGTMSVDRERASSEYDAAVERLGRSAGAMTTDALKYYISTSMYQSLNDTHQTLNDSHQTLNDTNQTLNDNIQTLNDSHQTLNDTIQTLNNTIQLKSLSGLLALTTKHSTANKLVSKETATAHLKPKHEEANAIETLHPRQPPLLWRLSRRSCAHLCPPSSFTTSVSLTWWRTWAPAVAATAYGSWLQRRHQ